MSGRLIRYPEERALENAAYGEGVVPTRIFAFLLPVHRVEIEATVTDGEPYELIDRYLERGIAEAGLNTVPELAGFLALDEVLVDRALRFLGAIGHVVSSDGKVSLTELGLRSVRDKVRYVVTRKDRRRLYFEAFGSRPLTSPYYDSRAVTFLDAAGLHEAMKRPSDGPWFRPLTSTYGFRPDALAELCGRPDRDRYNLPEGINDPKIVGAPEGVHLPAYIVRAVDRQGVGARVRYLAYTQAGDEADPDVGDLCHGTPEIASLIETEERESAGGPDRSRVDSWLARRNLDSHRPVQIRDGMCRITLPGSAFGGDGRISLLKLGSFVVLGNGFFHVWCEDARVRRRALLERADTYLSARLRVDPVVAGERIGRIARQLELGEVDLPTLKTMAAKAGRRDLAAQLSRLLERG